MYSRNDFKLQGEDKALCFDLQNDELPSASLVVGELSSSFDHTIMLPFQIRNVENVEEIWSSTASYKDYSIINYKCVKGSGNQISTINYTPVFIAIDGNMESEEDLPEGIYLKKSGLDRKLIFKYSDNDIRGRKIPLNIIDTIGLIEVRLPALSTGKEIKDGMTTLPKPLLDQRNIKYFKAEKQSNGKILKVGYQLALNKNQQQFFDWFIKILASWLIPLVEFFVIHKSKSLTQRRKNIIKWILFPTQLIVVGILVYLISKGSISGQNIVDGIQQKKTKQLIEHTVLGKLKKFMFITLQ